MLSYSKNNANCIVNLNGVKSLFTLNRGAAVDRCDLALHFQHPVSSRARYAIHASLKSQQPRRLIMFVQTTMTTSHYSNYHEGLLRFLPDN